jgi:hypothetical protein
MSSTEFVARFCSARGIPTGTVTVVPRLGRALQTAQYRGSDARWSAIARWTADDDPDDTLFGTRQSTVLAAPARTAYDRVLRAEAGRRNVDTPTWLSENRILDVDGWARSSLAMCDARIAGLGWLVPVRGELLVVPAPRVRTAEGRPDVLHDDTGRPAVEWADGPGGYFLHGAEFEESLYHKVIRSELLIQEIAQLADADQRSVALRYMSFERLVIDSDAELLDVGVRGTRLYRLPLPFRIRRDRVPGYGFYDYFIHMRDASHPEREFVEWVDPQVGRLRDAELCQARAFGITLEQWLAVRLEG